MRHRRFLVAAICAIAAACGGSKLDLGHSSDAGTTDASAITCESTCDRVIACGLATSDKRAQCLAQCIGVDQVTLACVATSQCQDIPKCEPTSGPVDASVIDDFQNAAEIQRCQDDACNNLQFFGCLSAKELEICRAACSTTAREKRNSFTACASSPAGGCSGEKPERDCYLVFVGD